MLLGVITNNMPAGKHASSKRKSASKSKSKSKSKSTKKKTGKSVVKKYIDVFRDEEKRNALMEVYAPVAAMGIAAAADGLFQRFGPMMTAELMHKYRGREIPWEDQQRFAREVAAAAKARKG